MGFTKKMKRFEDKCLYKFTYRSAIQIHAIVATPAIKYPQDTALRFAYILY
jgi:hypothetical protein